MLVFILASVFAQLVYGTAQQQHFENQSFACIKVAMTAKHGTDGWNGAEFTVKMGNRSVATGALASGASGTDTVCLTPACYSFEVSKSSRSGEVEWKLNDGFLVGGDGFAATDFWVFGPSDLNVAPCVHAPTLAISSSQKSSARTLLCVSNYSQLAVLIIEKRQLIVTAAATFVFSGGIELDSSDNLEIAGDSSVFDGNESSRLFLVDGGKLKLRNLVLRNGAAAGDGGAISALNGAFVELTNCIVADSIAQNGGALAVGNGSELVMMISSVTNNSANASSPVSISLREASLRCVSIGGDAALARAPARSMEEAPSCIIFPH